MNIAEEKIRHAKYLTRVDKALEVLYGEDRPDLTESRPAIMEYFGAMNKCFRAFLRRLT